MPVYVSECMYVRMYVHHTHAATLGGQGALDPLDLGLTDGC